jgi:DNA polymerase
MLWLDTETYCETPITHGTYKYAERVEVLLFAWAIGDDPVQVWDATGDDEMPEALEQALRDDTAPVCFHNSQFDREALGRNWWSIPVERTVDTMILALEHSLPGSLGQLCQVLGVPTDQAKDMAGKKLIQLFCKPRPKNMKLRRATKETHPEKWANFCEYARLDVEAMREVYRRLPKWNASPMEVSLWQLDQRINARGFAVDLDLARAAVKAITREQTRLSRRAAEITEDAVASTTQRDALLRHFEEAYGITLPDLRKSTVERTLKNSDSLPPEVVELLTARLQASTSSTAKYETLLKSVSSDGRLRGTMQFCGASRTGRFSGRIFQPHNLPQPSNKPDMINAGINAIKAGIDDICFDNPMELLSDAIRGCIVATEGMQLAVADYANIEGRVAAWVAGEDWKLKAFEEYDAGTGPDLYCVAYGKSFGIDPREVNKAQRQVGKVQELALQYGGGANAFQTFALAFGIDLDDLADQAWEVIPKETREKSESLYHWIKSQKDTRIAMAQRAWVVCDSFKTMWRQAHPGIVTYWETLQDAVLSAIATPKAEFPAGPCTVSRIGTWLRIQLPSGRYLIYPGIRIEPDGQIGYKGIDQFTRKWTLINSYGPKFFENIVQAISRDILCYGMLNATQAGFEVVLTVHDEILAEHTEFDSQHLRELMQIVPPWIRGLPLHVEGFTTERYRK